MSSQTASASGNKVNYLKKVREEHMLSKAELARKAGLSVLTIDRIEKGYDCRTGTKRKILEALGISIKDRDQVFPRQEENETEQQPTQKARDEIWQPQR